MTTPEINAIFDTARVADRAAATAREALAQAMLQAMRNLLPAGTVIKLGTRPLPEYLLGVRTMSGHDRGTKTFRIVSVTHVVACPYAPELSTWSAEAVPVSEKTGKDMSAATHGVGSGATVTLHGNMGCTMLDDIKETSALDRLITLVAEHATPAAALAA